MNRKEKERQERLQRMLARDRGELPPSAPAQEPPAQSPAGQTPGGQTPAGGEPPRRQETGEKSGRETRQDTPGQENTPRGTSAAPDNTIHFPGMAGNPSDAAPGQDKTAAAPPPESSVTRESLAARRAERRRHPNSPILRRRIRRRRQMIAAIVLAVLLLFAWAMGAVGAVMTMASDLADSISISFEPGGWPASTGIPEPIQIEELAGGFVELGSTDVAVFGSNGAKVRTIQPGYARPAIAVGNTRFALYNRAGTELRVENRTRSLYTKTFESNILLCAMSDNGTTAVVTESTRYAANVQVLDPLGQQQYQWYATQTDGTPVALTFASDNHRFAAGCISTSGGQVSSKIYLMDLDADQPTAVYTADPGSLVLHLYWQGRSQVLAVLSDCAVLINASDGQEVARYDYGGASLQDVDRAGESTALLLSGQGNATLVVLGSGLNERMRVDAAHAEQVCAASTALYLSGGLWVRCVGYDGATQWEITLDAPPLAVLDADQLLVFTGSTASVLAP